MTDQLMLPVRPGAVMIAQKAGVPIIPCYVDGAPYDGRPYSPLYMPAKVRVVIGEPIDLSEYERDDNEDGFAGRVMLDVVAQIAHLAGRDDFEPQLAGRRWKPTREEVERAMAKARRKA